MESSIRTIMSFDLSTICTGVAIGFINTNSIVSVETISIIPPSAICPTTFGFLKSKQKTTTKGGKVVTSYVKYKGEIVTVKGKKERDNLVKYSSETGRLQYTADEIGKLISLVGPNLIIQEDNMAFRSMQVTRQLGEVAGVLQGLATVNGIPLVKVNENHARGQYNTSEILKNFCASKTPEELKVIKDVTKHALKEFLFSKYSKFGLNPEATTDESDALLLLDYWLNKNIKDWYK